jgi:hypothetical protein
MKSLNSNLENFLKIFLININLMLSRLNIKSPAIFYRKILLLNLHFFTDVDTEEKCLLFYLLIERS